MLCAVVATAEKPRSESAAPMPVSSTSANLWEPGGWGGGGWYWSTAFHPTRDGVIYLGQDVGGVSKTTDHGMTWRMINNGLTDYSVYSLAVDRSNPDTVYAATGGGLNKSTDAGEHWQFIPHTGKKELRITGERNFSVRAIAVDPVNGNNVYAASPGGRIYKSRDGAKTWSVAYETNATSAKPVYSVAVAAKQTALVVAATEACGLLLSEDAGKTWRELDTPKQATSAVFADTDPNIMFGAFGKDGVWKSTDRGKTWNRSSEGIPEKADIREVVISPVNTLDIFGTGGGAACYSIDGGKTWKQVEPMFVDLEGNPTRHYGGTNPRQTIARTKNISINPQNPKELYIASDWRSVWSGDGGLTWFERVRGSDISCITDIRFTQGRVYASAMDEGVLVSEDNGKTWRQLWPLKWSAEESGHCWRIAANTVDGVDHLVTGFSPWDSNPKLNIAIISDDGGKTHEIVKSGLPDYLPKKNTMWENGFIRALATDPANPNILYAGIDGDAEPGKSGGGIFKTEDGGRHWKQLPHQPGSRRMFNGLVVDPTDSQRIFWGACGVGGGVWMSEDGGDTWENVFKTDTWIWDVLVARDGRVYASGSNLWRSVDHGKTWTQMTHFTNRRIQGFDVDPRDSKTVWVSAINGNGISESGIYKTTDDGATWQDITGNIPNVKPLLLRFNPETRELWAGWVGLYKIKQ